MLQLRYLLILPLLIVTTPVIAQISNNKTGEGFVSVCDVLAHRADYDGKVVALIGRWSATDEGFWLADDCEKPLKTGDYTWSNIIFLSYDPSSASIFRKGPKLDLVGANKKIAELTTRKPTNQKLEWAVVYGRIETKEELSTVVAGDGKSIFPAGYGHLNAAPAQIVYREKDLIIVPRKQP